MMFSKTAYASLMAAATALMLVGCDRPTQPEVRSGASIGDKIEQGAGKVAQSAEDVKITASIKTELAKDPSLSALRIDVDTRDGLVSLHGTAPDSVSRERATRVAAAVKGVLGVDNKLVVNS